MGGSQLTIQKTAVLEFGLLGSLLSLYFFYLKSFRGTSSKMKQNFVPLSLIAVMEPPMFGVMEPQTGA
jgi:hypothetical protein